MWLRVGYFWNTQCICNDSFNSCLHLGEHVCRERPSGSGEAVEKSVNQIKEYSKIQCVTRMEISQGERWLRGFRRRHLNPTGIRMIKKIFQEGGVLHTEFKRVSRS